MPLVATDTKNVLSLCSGGGGLDLGLRLAVPGTRTVCYLENEVTACGVLASHMEDGGLDDAPLWTDLRTFDGRAWRGVVDIVIGGYPCQPFSNAGKRLGADDPRHLWPEVERIVREVEPEWCFFENVGAHLRLGFYEVARSLQGMGYTVAGVLLTAEEVGAPHGRERLFILAQLADTERSERGAEPRAQYQERPEVSVGTGRADYAQALADTSRVSGALPSSGESDGARGGVASGTSRVGDDPTVGHADGGECDGWEQESGRRSQRRAVAAGAGRADDAEPLGHRDLEHGDGCRDIGARWRAELADRRCSVGHAASLGRGEGRAAHVVVRGWDSPPGAGSAVGDPDLEGLEGRFGAVGGSLYELPAWPPGPENEEGWLAVVAAGRLDLLPATPQSEVRGVADGLAGGLGRSDQLHILGNGVVPQQAAYAFEMLMEALCSHR